MKWIFDGPWSSLRNENHENLVYFLRVTLHRSVAQSHAHALTLTLTLTHTVLPVLNTPLLLPAMV